MGLVSVGVSGFTGAPPERFSFDLSRRGAGEAGEEIGPASGDGAAGAGGEPFGKPTTDPGNDASGDTRHSLAAAGLKSARDRPFRIRVCGRKFDDEMAQRTSKEDEKPGTELALGCWQSQSVATTGSMGVVAS